MARTIKPKRSHRTLKPKRSHRTFPVPESNEKPRRTAPIIPHPAKKLIYNRGGMLLNPPKECPWRFISKDGGEWVDLSICLVNCKKNDNCERHQWYSKATAAELTEEWENGGVRFFHFPERKKKRR